MPAPILHLGAIVAVHARRPGDAASRRSRASCCRGQPVVTLTSPYAIAGCAPHRHRAAPPCVTGQWISRRDARAGRRRAGRDDDRARRRASPTGTPMLPVVAQTRVLAT